jgi:hypothetical protein
MKMSLSGLLHDGKKFISLSGFNGIMAWFKGSGVKPAKVFFVLFQGSAKRRIFLAFVQREAKP